VVCVSFRMRSKILKQRFPAGDPAPKKAHPEKDLRPDGKGPGEAGPLASLLKGFWRSGPETAIRSAEGVLDNGPDFLSFLPLILRPEATLLKTVVSKRRVFLKDMEAAFGTQKWSGRVNRRSLKARRPVAGDQQQRPEQRRLSRPVRADQGQDFSLP